SSADPESHFPMMPTDDPTRIPAPASLPAVIPPAGAGAPAVRNAHPAPSTSPDPAGLLKALLRCWPRAVGAGVLVAAVVAGATYYIVPPAKYSAKGMLHVNSTPPRIVLQVKEAVPDYGSYQRTQLAMLRSRLVLSAALNKEEVKKSKALTSKVDAVEWL